MDTRELMELEAVREMFPVDENGQLPEGSRLLLSAMEEVRFAPGEDIVSYGESGDDGMYILMRGTAQVLNSVGEQINTPMGHGSIVGEMALIREERRQATVRAETEVVCAHLSRNQFYEAARNNKKLYGALLNLAYQKTTGLVREQARLHSELEIAARIQNGLLKQDFRDIEEKLGIRVAASMSPAKEVGGDFYDLFLVTEKKACIVMADVSGKGVPAALFMTMAKTHIKNYGMLDMPLTELAYRVNNQLCEDNPEEMFVTAFIGMLDMDTGILTYVNAGHNRPYLFLADSGFSQIPSYADMVLGLWEHTQYREQTVDLSSGRCLYLYTDGVTEAENCDGDMFGDGRLCEALNRGQPGETPEDLTRRVSMVLRDYAGAAVQTDDITMLYIIVAGQGGRPEKGE